MSLASLSLKSLFYNLGLPYTEKMMKATPADGHSQIQKVQVTSANVTLRGRHGSSADKSCLRLKIKGRVSRRTVGLFAKLLQAAREVDNTVQEYFNRRTVKSLIQNGGKLGQSILGAGAQVILLLNVGESSTTDVVNQETAQPEILIEMLDK